MIILSHGFKKPETGDKGSLFFPALEFDIQQLNDHTHNGTDSSKLTSQAITAVSDTIPSGGWIATSGGTYRQLVTTPASILFDDYGLYFRIATGPATGHVIYPSIEKNAINKYYVYINDPSVDLLVSYIS